MDEIRYQVVVDRNVSSKVSGVLAFGDFTSDSKDATIYGVSDLTVFFHDLILGRPFPLVFVTRGIDNLGVLAALTLFLHRDLAIHPATPGFLAAVTLVDGLGVAGMAHLDRDVSRFFKLIRNCLQASQGKSLQESLALVVGWIRAYVISGDLPALPPVGPEPRIIDRGTDGFVFASTSHPDLLWGWEDLFRAGHLRGAIVHKVGADRWRVLGARKSTYLGLDLMAVASALNQAEEAMAEPAEWVSDGLWLKGPERGTLILPSALLRVLVKA